LFISDEHLRIRQTSPITVGGGGSVGLAFDMAHYTKISKGLYRNDDDELITTLVTHQNGKLLKNFVKEIKGKTCTVKISCVDAAGADGPPITIDSHRHGPLVGKFDEDTYTYVANDDLFYNKNLSVKRVTVTSGGKTYNFDTPADWKGVIVVDDV
jgi:hypothetical protein